MKRIEWARRGLWIFLLAAILGAGFWMLDPDYGWHVRMGQVILEQGIPKTDPFSYTMSSYPFVDHEWLMNILMYWGEVTIGKNGLALIFGLITFGALYLTPRKKGWEVGVLLAASILMLRTGVRPQVLDWLLIAIMWQMWQTKRWILPIMFVIWVNLHGGFAIGMAMWLFMIIVKGIEDRRLRIEDGISWTLSFLATFVNPYGWRIWWEVGMQITDTQLRKNIAEWQPFISQIEPGFWFLALLWLFLAVREKKKEWWRTITVGVLLLAGISSLRHMAVFAVVASLELPRLLQNFWEELKGNLVKLRAKQLYGLFLTIAVGIYFTVVLLQTLYFWRGGFPYPKMAVEYLRKNVVSGRLFSEYGWGGYLIWKLPEYKVFIDGRMPSWRWPSYALSELRKGSESENAMEEYVKVSKDGEYQEIFGKYGVGTVLLPKPSKTDLLDEWNNKLAGSLRRLLGIETKERKELIKELEKGGWKKVYEDEVAVIYENI